MRHIKFQVGDVNRPLLSVSRMCKAGNAVHFDDQWAKIVNKATGQVTWAEEVNGVYVLESWVPDDADVQDFVRQGGHA